MRALLIKSLQGLLICVCDWAAYKLLKSLDDPSYLLAAIIFIAAGLGVLSWALYDKECPQSLAHRLSTVISYVAITVAYIAMALFCLPFVAAPIWLIFQAVISFPAIGLTILSLIIVSISSYFLLKRAINHNSDFNIIAGLRISTTLLLGTLVVAIISLPIAAFCAWTNIDYLTVPLTQYQVKSTIVLGIGSVGVLGIAVAIYEYLLKNRNIIIYTKERYLIFLRSFNYQEQSDRLNVALSKLNLPILKIGDPRGLNPNGIGDVFYLPSSNWKKQLEYYIQRAQMIVCAIDGTEGVAWEILTHSELSEKFVYHIPARESIEGFLRHCNRDSHKFHTALHDILQSILQHETTDISTFIIRNGVGYGGSLEMVMAVIAGENSIERLKQIIPDKVLDAGAVTATDMQNRPADKTAPIITPAFVTIMDFFRKWPRFIWNGLKKTFSYIAFVIIGPLWIITPFLFATAAVIVIFDPNIFYLDWDKSTILGIKENILAGTIALLIAGPYVIRRIIYFTPLLTFLINLIKAGLSNLHRKTD